MFNEISVKLTGVINKDGKKVRKTIQLSFIDSCRFVASAIDKLASNFHDDQCQHLEKFYTGDKVFKVMRRNSVYPYEYIDSWKKFQETKLPKKKIFLNMKGISNQDNEHAQQVWNKITRVYKNVTLGDYYDVYLVIDILLLANVFQTSSTTCLGHYKLDPVHFYIALWLAWQFLLKTPFEYYNHDLKRKDCTLSQELLRDIDMLLFENGIRGEIAQAVNRYVEANMKEQDNLITLVLLSSRLDVFCLRDIIGYNIVKISSNT